MTLPDFKEHVFNRDPGILEDNRSGRGPAHPHLLLFFACRNTRKILLDYKACELFTVNLGVNDEAAGPTRVGNKHLFSVEDIIFSVFREDRLCLGVQGICACAGFGEAVGPAPLAGRQFGKVLLFLLFIAEIDYREGPDPGMGAVDRPESGGSTHGLSHNGGADLV